MSAELRAQLSLALPLALVQLGSQLLGLVDTAMLGRYSEVALAGAGVANALLWTITMFGMGVIMGLDSLLPRAAGSGDHRRASALLRRGYELGLLLGLPLTLLAAASPAFMSMFGVTAEARGEATLYVFGRLPQLIPVLLFTASRSYLQAYSFARPLVVAMVVANLLNVVTNGVLIFGDRGLEAVGLPGIGLPELGALGAAVSTTIVSWATAALLYLAARRREPELELSSEVSEPVETEAPTIASIVRLGWPVGVQLFAELGIFALVGTLAGRLGTVPAAAHTLTLSLIAFAYNAIVGISAATSVRVGLALGRDAPEDAQRAGFLGLGLGVAFMIPVGLLYLLIPELLARLMTDRPAVIAAAVPLFYVAAMFQVGDALQAIGSGALRGAGDTRWPMWAHLSADYLLGLAVALYAAFYLEMGAVGLWWGLAIAMSLAGVIIVLRFARIMRTRMRAPK